MNPELLKSVYYHVLDLQDSFKREHALVELSKKREEVPDLAPILWYSYGTMAILLQEIVSVYPILSPPKLKAQQSDRVCTALALLQSIASHRNTRTLFLNGMFLQFLWAMFLFGLVPSRLIICAARIPLFLYPFLNTSTKSRPFEYLRLTSLGVIGALVKVALSLWMAYSLILTLSKLDDTEVINFLLSTEIIPLALRIMESGTELSKTVATFIIQKVLFH